MSDLDKSVALLTDPKTWRILGYLTPYPDHAVPTARLNQAMGLTSIKTETQRTRLFLRRMAAEGLVEGAADMAGAVRRWKITDKGRDLVRSVSERERKPQPFRLSAKKAR